MKAKHDFKYENDYKEYLRAYYAGLALQGLCASGYNLGAVDSHIRMVKRASKCADALINELNK